jgi:hypothetical protein
MGKYMVLIYDDEQKWIDGAEGTKEAMAGHSEFWTGYGDSIVAGDALQPTSTATSLRKDDAGTVQVTDGPFVETKEWVSGFWVIDAPDLDVALRLAAEGSHACGRRVEVRPFL